MRIAHLIIAHKNATQVERLIKALAHPNFDYYIYLDQKSNFKEFERLKEIQNVYLIDNTISVNWGGFTLLYAIILGTKYILDTKKNYGFINLLSGQDYPIKPASHIYDFLVEHKGRSFISYDEDSNSNWWRSAQNRFEAYHLNDFHFAGKYLVQSILNLVLPKRKFPSQLKMYGSNKGTWWMLSEPCANYVVTKIMDDFKLKKFLKYCWGTDEFVVQTLLMSSSYKSELINNNYRYIDWSAGGASPKTLTLRDYNEIANSEMLFARKFDMDVDKEILKEIDDKLLKN